MYIHQAEQGLDTKNINISHKLHIKSRIILKYFNGLHSLNFTFIPT